MPAATATAERPRIIPAQKPYCAYGAVLELFRFQGAEVLLSGPAGTGKSRGCLEKIHYICDNVPGIRALMVRKTRESLTESALVTFEEKVVTSDHPILASGGQRRMRQSYQYPNGSSLVVGGIDKPGKIMSTDYDVIYVQEAIELEENDWESLTTRLRNGVLHYQQILADTNPDTPTHWLKRRCDASRCKMLDSRHEDNPTVTPEYLSKLDNLTGPRKERLRFGRWVQAEGVVYEGWDRKTHLIDRFKIPWIWPRYWSVDFGYTCPFVCQFWAQDNDGRLYRYKEIYHSKRLVEDHAKQILSVLDAECRQLAAERAQDWGDHAIKSAREHLEPRMIVCDHDAEDVATLKRHLQLSTLPAKKEISPGIQAVASRLKIAGDGKPRLFMLRDSLVERDPVMDEAKKPLCSEEEIDSYVWDTANNRKKGEVPVDKDNHGMDAMRYLVAMLDGFGTFEAPKTKIDPPDRFSLDRRDHPLHESAAARRGLYGLGGSTNSSRPRY